MRHSLVMLTLIDIHPFSVLIITMPIMNIIKGGRFTSRGLHEYIVPIQSYEIKLAEAMQLKAP